MGDTSIIESLNKKLHAIDNISALDDIEKRAMKDLLINMNDKVDDTKLKKSEKKWNEMESRKAGESKETSTKSLEFENDTFKIDSKWWREVTNKDKDDPFLGKFVWKKPKVKANDTWDVVEYLDGDAKWEQIFITYDAFIREVKKAKNCTTQEEVEKKYLMTEDELKEKMKDKPSGSKEYEKFYNQEVKDHLAGYWDPGDEKFSDVGGRSGVWLVGGGSADFGQTEWNWGDYGRECGFSGRLLKN